MVAPIVEVRAESLAELASKINAAHEAGERASWKGLEHFRAAGEALLRAKAQCGHGKWLAWLEKNVSCTERQARRYMAFAKSDVTSDLESQWRAISGNAADEKAAHVSHATGEHEWYTPSPYLEAARKVLGAIDLDPASSDVAQENVKAKRYYTLQDDGLAQDWSGRVWLNPPYAADVIGKFTDKLAQHFAAKDVTAAILLTNNATETGWFSTVARIASAVCFPFGRISYLDKSGKPANTPLQGQSLLYFGENSDKFCKTFASLGRCWRD